MCTLQLTNSDGSATYTPGGSITYTVVVTNAGPSFVTGATVTDTLPASITGATWTAAYTGSGSTGPASGTGSISTNAVNPGGTATFTVTGTVAPTATGNLINTADVVAPAGITDPTPSNNTAIDIDTPAGVIAGTVWQDFKGQGNGNAPTNGDGIREPGEKGYAGDLVTLLDPFGGEVTAITDADGRYQFSKLALGVYSVRFSQPLLINFTLENQGTDPAKMALRGIVWVTF